jgi:hypothetical protein
MPIEKNTHIVVDNSLVIYQRERTSVWQCKYLLKGKWYRCSTREHDMTAAIRSANMILMEAHMRERFHVVPTSRLFRDVAKLAIKRMEEEMPFLLYQQKHIQRILSNVYFTVLTVIKL